MYKPESIREFIERRSKGESCSSIAEDLEISRSTLFAWNAKYKAQILAASSEQSVDFHHRAITDIEDTLNTTCEVHVEVMQSVRTDYLQLTCLPIDRRIALIIKLNKEMDRLRLAQQKHIQAIPTLLAATPETDASTISDTSDPSDPSDKSDSSPEIPKTSPETVQKPTTPTLEPPQPQEVTNSNTSPETSPENSESSPETVQISFPRTPMAYSKQSPGLLPGSYPGSQIPTNTNLEKVMPTPPDNNAFKF